MEFDHIEIYFNNRPPVRINHDEIEKMIEAGKVLEEAYQAVQAARRIGSITIPGDE